MIDVMVDCASRTVGRVVREGVSFVPNPERPWRALTWKREGMASWWEYYETREEAEAVLAQRLLLGEL